MKTRMILTAALSALAACIPVNALAAPSETAADAPAIVITDEDDEKTVAVSTEIDEDTVDTYGFIYTVSEEGADGSIVVMGENDAFDNLTEEENAELKDLFAQQEAIFNAISDGNPDMTEDEYEAALEERQPELDEMDARITELLEKAGVDTFSFDDGDEYSYACICITDEDSDEGTIILNEDEIAEIEKNGCLTRTVYISDEN